MFICLCYCYSIEANTFAMVIDVVGAHDGSVLVIHGMADLLAHGTFGDIVSNKALGDLMARELFAEGEVGSSITKVTIAAAMDGVESRADVVFDDDGNRVLRGRVSSREWQRCRCGT